MDGPVISDIGIYNLGKTTVSISWTTDVAGTSRVDYGTTASYGSNSTSSASVTRHTIFLSGLTANTSYNYKVTTVDGYSNSVESTDRVFTTRTATYKPGDANASTAVDATDLSLVLANYNKSRQTFAQGNVDNDPAGNIDDMDVLLVTARFGL